MATPLTVQIMMLGGRRAGKTSALASMYDCFDREFKGTQLSIATANGTALDALEAKRQELEDYLAKASRNENFVPDEGATQGDMTYRFNLKIKEKPDTIHLDFYDYPGEWLCGGDSHYDQIAAKVSSSDVLMIIVDTPYLMEHDGQYNDTRNRCFRIQEAIKAIDEIKTAIPKLVMFVPIKCEKYAHEGRMNDVYQKIASDRCYGSLIEYLKGSCEIAITPIQTIGTAEFLGFDFDEKSGEVLLGKEPDGKELPSKPLYGFTSGANDAAKRQGLGRKFAAEPKYCEQLAVYTLYYVLTYAAKVAELKEAEGKKKLFNAIGPKLSEAALRLVKTLISSQLLALIPGETLTELIQKLRDRFDFASAQDFLDQRDVVFKKMKTAGNGYEIIYPDILEFKGEHA